MAGRPAIKVDNRLVADFLSQFDRTNPAPDWIDNIIRGAAQIGDSNPSSPRALMAALMQLPELTNQTAANFVNRKQEAMGFPAYKKRYCLVFFSRLRFAHRGILFHFERIYKMPLISAHKIEELP